MTPVMLRAKSVANRGGGGLISDDEEGLTAVETSTPNRHTLASSGSGAHPAVQQRSFIGGSTGGINSTNGTVGIETSSTSSIQSRRYHSKSLSLSEGKTLAKAFETPSLRLCTFSGSSQVFQQNRSLWEKRADPAVPGGGAGTGAPENVPGDRNSRNAAPDLVLDLPAANSASSSSSNSSSSLLAEDGDKDVIDGPASPDALDENGGGVGSGSGADCFAHNQYTLKKNDKFMLETSRHTFAMDNNNKEQSSADGPPVTAVSGGVLTRGPASVLHISKEEEQQQQNAETQQPPPVIAERNTHKFITQFADLKLTGGSLPVMKGGGNSGGGGGEVEIPIKPILRRDKPQILRKPILGSSSGPSSLGGGGMMSFNAKGSSSGNSGDADATATGAKSLE